MLEITASLQQPAGSQFRRRHEIKPLNVVLMSREGGEKEGEYTRPASHLPVHDINASQTSAGGEPVLIKRRSPHAGRK